MNGKFVIDSNIIIEIFRGNQEIIELVSGASKIYIPVIVLGELYFGANKSQQTEKRIREVELLESEVEILSINAQTAKIYGQLKNQLKKKGRPIPENDIWIAAIAKQINLPLLTRDKHFKNIDDIDLESVE